MFKNGKMWCNRESCLSSMHVCVENANGTSSEIQYVGVTFDKNQTLQPLKK